jgi:hypothetical protein
VAGEIVSVICRFACVHENVWCVVVWCVQVWVRITASARELICGLLEKDPLKRCVVLFLCCVMQCHVMPLPPSHA